MNTGFQWDTSRTLVMGVLNVTPDSFSDGGQFAGVEQAVAQAQRMIAAGADLIDIGGESTRPGAAPVSAAEEWARIGPVLQQIAGFGCQVSVDTTKAEVAARAIAAGARVVNDITALRGDARLVEVVRDTGAGLVLMHMQGTPQTMQQQPHYDDVVSEVRGFLAERIAFATSHGIPRERIAVDPGIGFGKTVAHNLQLLHRLAGLHGLGCPVLVGTSRKSFIGQVLNRGPADRLAGTAATVAWAVTHGARIVRVHDVAEMVDVVRMTEAIQRGQETG